MSTVSYNVVICVNHSAVSLSWDDDQNAFEKNRNTIFIKRASRGKPVLRTEKKIKESGTDVPYFKETASKYAWMDREAPKGF